MIGKIDIFKENRLTHVTDLWASRPREKKSIQNEHKQTILDTDPTKAYLQNTDTVPFKKKKRERKIKNSRFIEFTSPGKFYLSVVFGTVLSGMEIFPQVRGIHASDGEFQFGFGELWALELKCPKETNLWKWRIFEGFSNFRTTHLATLIWDKAGESVLGREQCQPPIHFVSLELTLYRARPVFEIVFQGVVWLPMALFFFMAAKLIGPNLDLQFFKKNSFSGRSDRFWLLAL